MTWYYGLYTKKQRGIKLTSEEFKKLREKAGFTQEKAAQVLGVSVGTVRNWEQGRAKILHLTAVGIRGTFKESYEVN